MTPKELEQLLFRHMPPPLFRNVLRAVFQAYGTAWSDCRGRFSASQFENMVGYEVRGKLEDGLAAVAARFPGIKAVNRRAPGSKWNRTELHSGPVLLVENAVETPCAMLNWAEFRRTLAARNQRAFFPDESRHHDDPLYVALVHSRSVWPNANGRQRWGHLPGSTYVAFPARDLNCYLHEINLFDLFPDVVLAATPQAWDTEAKVRYVQRARRVV